MNVSELGCRDLTLAEIERLSLLIEEAAEVQQVCTKILRHGWNSCHPDSGKSNHLLLHEELGDFAFARDLLVAAGDLKLVQLIACKNAAQERKPEFLHHNSEYFKDEI